MTLRPPDPADEGVHPLGPEPLWNESWYFDWCTPDASLGGYGRVGHYPNLGVVWYWACLVGADRPLLTVIDHTVALPPADRPFQVHGAHLWADHDVLAPLQRFQARHEAHAVSLDDPAETYGRMYGDVAPFAFDLTWETDGEPFRYPAVLDRYEIPCRVEGEVELADGVIPIDAWGQRDHSWGVRDWWLVGHVWFSCRLEDGTRLHAAQPQIPGLEWAAGYVAPAGGESWEIATAAVEQTPGPEGMPSAARIELAAPEHEPIAVTVEPVAWSPVLLTSPEGRRARFPRAMCRYRVDAPGDGRVGVGWIEFNQPEPAG